MKVPVSWLREYVDTTASVAEIAERLSISTCEVERIAHRGVPDLDGNVGLYRVGRVVEAGKHPNADRLQLCRVDVGEGEPRQIVCGAWNFGSGATVAVALPGAVLPDGQTLTKATLRGEVSEGMILSERELELGQDHTGILVLTEAHEPGTPLGDVLPLGEDVLEVETTPNRPDLLSVYGIAREVAALTGGELRPMPGSNPRVRSGEMIRETGTHSVDVAVDDPDGCPVYIGRLFRDVAIAPSPPWLKARLMAAGQRPISNVVDVTNYVMLALGSPLHAFDADKLPAPRILVRRAREGEEIRTLDGVVRKLDPADLLITDGERPIALAAIMGGEETEVTGATTSVLLEAANFEPVGILQSSERLRLRTEGSNRWEKGVDPLLARPAAELATDLIVETSGARWLGEGEAIADLPPPSAIRLRPDRVNAVNGLDVEPAEQREILTSLGFAVADDWNVAVPSWRARDVTREIDLVEEVARVRLEDVPFTLPLRRAVFGRLTKEQRLHRVVEDVLVGCGFSEAYTWSLQAGDRNPQALRVPEPISAELAVLRTSLLDGLVASARRNLDLGVEDVALFEIARVYLPNGDKLPEERWRVGGITSAGFFGAKGAVEALHDSLKLEPRFERAEEPFLHPGKAAHVEAGWVGELHPELGAEGFGAFELDLAKLFERVPERIAYEDVITYPSLRQDLAVIVDEDVPAGSLVDAARAAVPELREAHVFDVYRGDPVPEGRKSVALALSFQAPDRTLSDDEAAGMRERIVAALSDRFGAELRGS
jgi:phenylalanyl-tRNA synthetase beta chain